MLHLKVCHSSAFQTISRRSVYIKIINYSDSISANLKKYNANKTTCDEKTALISALIQIETRLSKDFFLWWKDFVQNF